jgi:hypothetical protein
MSPRYFAKFTGQPVDNDMNWFHFTPSNYAPGSMEYKIHRYKITRFIKKLFRIK